MRQLFVDLDGVLADFDGHYLNQFGINLDRAKEDGVPNPDGMFDRINKHGTFFRDLPRFEHTEKMWKYCKSLHKNPIILTGIAYSVKGCEDQKREWVREHIGNTASVICCKSEEKYKHAKHGDVLIDDWHKYRSNWESIGGIFILHKSMEDSIRQAYGLFCNGILG